MTDLVSLLVPVYNSEKYLPRFLESVLAQTWEPLELILCDDGSSDGSVEVIKSYKDRFEERGISVSLIASEHKGQASAINDALKLAKGEYLTWCDSDDYMFPGNIEKKVLWLKEHPYAGMVRNDGLVYDGDNETVIRSSTKEEDRKEQDIFDQLLWQTTYCFAGCYMVRMSLFDSCYPDRGIPLSAEGQNLQLLLPPASRSVCGFVPEVLHHYYQRKAGHSSQSRSYTQTLERINGFSDLFLRILPYCDVDQEKYKQVIEEIKKKNIEQLRYSMVMRVKKEMGES